MRVSDSKLHQIIIIGAGPSGLSLAYHLKEIGLEPLVLEAGEKVGNSFENMPDFLSLISYWTSNYLIKKDKYKFFPGSQVHAKDFARYLQSFPSRFQINIKTKTQVKKIDREDQEYLIETSKGILRSNIVINCTGYYSSPFYPNYSGLETTELLKLHFRDYKNIKSLKESKNVLVVGSRLSAGQVLIDLEKENIQLSLSSRSKVQSLMPSFLLKIILYFVDHLEKPMEYFSNKKIESRIPMFYESKKLITNGRVKLYPAIKSFHDNSVTFENGATAPFNAVIFATGFTPKLDYLGDLVELNSDKLPLLSDNFEALYSRNLFFLGLDHQRNMQSRLLRGIRSDAKKLALLIKTRLNT